MPERLERLLGEPIVRAIDAFFGADARLIAALVARDELAAQTANAERRQYLSDWLSLLVERLDGRAAEQLVNLHEDVDELAKRLDAAGLVGIDLQDRIRNLEELMRVGRPARIDDPPPDGDDGHDSMRPL